MTSDQHAAIRRVRVRSWLMGEEARHTLTHSAAAAGDERTVVLCAAVVEALRQLQEYTAGLVEGETCDE